MTASQSPRFLNYDQASEYLGVNAKTLRVLVCRKRIPHVRLGPRTVRFDREALEAWLTRHSVPAQEGAAAAAAEASPSGPSEG